MFFCFKCYSSFKEDIDNNVEWVKVLKSFARKERRHPPFKFIYLGDTWDIDTDNNLVFKEKTRDAFYNG